MAELPSGTVTFLVTDVEGSTKLLHELGAEAYAEALAEHRRIVREAVAAHDGVEVDTQGDAFFVAFPTAPGALAAAGAIQEQLQAPIRLRMGLHTGTPLRTDEGYVGADVHRAARIAAAGHGGQALVSASTAALVETDLHDLGEHRLKDLVAAERIYQLGTDAHPPLRSLYRTNLPVPATVFLGRERELAEVLELLTRDDVRLLTLTGPGGTGKTRLALQVAAEAYEDYPDGVFWVPLAPLRDAAGVLERVAEMLGDGENLAARIADKRMLLLLDNFEHLLAAAPGVGELLAACPNVDVLVTSRELLQLRSEQTYAVPALRRDEGTALFLARARAVTTDVDEDDTVRELCERLENLPLALELAASRTRHLTPGQLLARLSDRLDLLTGARDADPRQQTLRATIAWSYDLLEPREQHALARLSVFAGGWTLESAEAVADADLDVLSSLVDKSLVRRTRDRYWMLETIREFAAERLAEREEVDLVSRRHAEHLLRLASSLGFTVESIETGDVQRHDVALAEESNFRVALEWALDSNPELGLRLATALENFWVSHTPHEALRWFDELVEAADEIPAALRAFVPRFRGNLLIVTGNLDLGIEEYERSLDIYRRQADEYGVAIVAHRLGINVYRRGEKARGRQLIEESLASSRTLGFRVNEAMAIGSLGSIDYREGGVALGLEALVRAVELSRAYGFAWMEANMLGALITYSMELDRRTDAERYSREYLPVVRSMGDRRHAVQALAFAALLAKGRGEVELAGLLWGAVEAEEQRGALGLRPRMEDWDEERQRFAREVLAVPSQALGDARARGRLLSLEEAMDAALASID